MALDSKNKKRKAAPAPTSTAKKVKNSAATPSNTVVENSPKPVAPAVGGATRKRAADFFGESVGENEDGGWRQLDSSKTSDSKVAIAKETPAAKPEAEKSKRRSKTKRLKIDATNGEEQRVGDISAGHGETAETLNEPGLPKASRKSKRSKFDGAALEVVGKSMIEEPALKLGATQPQGAKKAKMNGVSKVKSGRSQQKQVTETLSEGGSDASDDEEEDDQTVALLNGFESSEDEGESLHEGFIEGQALPDLPKEKKTRKRLRGIEGAGNGTPGVIYVGRIPHGFYEREMRSYFTQFGEILRLRLSRNKKTGRSKHYAFIEFASSEVARIVADTMDNYLMFGHILKCKTVPQEQVHENLWEGANKRFKKIPRNRIEGRKLEATASKESWDKRVKTEEKRRKEKSQKLKDIGYEFNNPTLKMAGAIERKEETKVITGGSEIELTQGDVGTRGGEVSNMIAVSEEATSRRAKKAAKKAKEAEADGKKKKAKELEALVPSAVASEEADASKKKVGKKAKASKTGDLGDTASTIKVGEKQSGVAGKAKKLKMFKKAPKRE